MKKIYLLLLSSFLLLFPSIVSANTYIQETINWHTVKVIKYDLSSTDYTFKIWRNEDNEATSLRDLMDKNNGITAVNWVYYCPSDYAECNWEDYTINERYIDWKKYAWYDDTWDRVVFALDKNNVPFLFQTNKINADKETDIYNWLWNYPLLLEDWKDMIEYYRDRNLIDSKMKAKMNRNFICSDKDWKTLYFWFIYNIELDLLHWVLTKLWCYNALNLDAGASSAMIYNWRYVVWPWRVILDWIVIERNWLDTSDLRNKATTVISKIKNIISTKSYANKMTYLDNLSDALTKARVQIYNANSTDTYDESWSVNWYTIDMDDLLLLKKVYIINYLDKLIYELEKNLKS